MPNPDNVQIAPAEGKLGILVPGMGAVTTTFIAGLEAIKRGIGKPIGSLTQLGTIRLGKAYRGPQPRHPRFRSAGEAGRYRNRLLGHLRG